MSFRDLVIKKESYIAIGFSILLLIFSLVLLLKYYGFIGSYYKDVNVNYKINNNSLIIFESWNTKIAKDKHVLYRSLSARICLNNDECTAQILNLSCKYGVAYIKIDNKTKDLSGNILNPSSVVKLKNNEVGCYKESGYYNGKEILSILYKVPLDDVKETNYIHALFSEWHLGIIKLHVKALNAEHTKKFIPVGNSWIKINVKTGEIKAEGNLKQDLFFILLFSLVPFFAWFFFGREKKFYVPEVMHTLPDKNMDPLELNVIVNPSLSVNSNGLTAAFMELYAKGLIDFEKDTEKIPDIKRIIKFGKISKPKIFIKKNTTPEGLHNYVSKIFEYIKLKSINDSGKLYYIPEPGLSLVLKAISREGQKNVSKIGVYVLLILLMFFSSPIFDLLKDIYKYFLFGSIFFILAFSSVFCRYKGDTYKKVLEWEAFGKMLEDFAMIKKYLKEDIVMWKEWLIYAAALGKAKKLIESLKSYSEIPASDIDNFYTVYSVSLASYAISNLKYSSFGGGGSGGGGFGGGGGGVR
jgi:hypothetical protein